jgi:hypothetical protein
MKKKLGKLSLDQPATYRIKVPGKLDASWADWIGSMKYIILSDGDEPPVATLTGTFDQAALQGALRRLYSLGLPLISVIWIGWSLEDNN